MLFLLLACSSQPTAEVPKDPQPDADTTKATIDALCKLLEGANLPCERSDKGIISGDLQVGVDALVVPATASMGVYSLRGTIQLDGPTKVVTHLSGFGGNKDEAIKRSLHEWALVSGTAALDGWIDTTGRPTLEAVDKGASAEKLHAGDRLVVRGWKLQRPNGELEHQQLLDAIAGQLTSPGLLNLEVTRQAGETKVECWFQGKPADGLCKAARAWSWPGAEYELRLGYNVLDAPVASEATEGGEPTDAPPEGEGSDEQKPE